MTLAQICLVVVVNLLAGTYMARLHQCEPSTGGSIILVTMILLGFGMIWRAML